MSPTRGAGAAGADVAAPNEEALRRIGASQAILTGLAPAGVWLPALSEDEYLHAGPPLDHGWEDACGALRGAVIATLMFEGRAHDPVEAERIAASGEVQLVSAALHDVLGTYGGIITRQTHVFAVENPTGGTRAYAAINEGRGKALRYGAHDAEALARYSWIEGEFAKLLAEAIERTGGIDLFAILRQALHMGDEGHSRQKAASALFANSIAPHFVQMAGSPVSRGAAMRFLSENEIFFLPLTMAAAKAAMLWVEGIAGCSVVTALAANGVDWGVRVSGAGRRWFTAPVPPITGSYFAGFGVADANPVIGDSEIAETFGLGAFAMAGAPALARYVGGDVESARRMALQMYEITLGEHPGLTIAALDYRGIPMGIDIRRVVESGIAPVFNTGIAHASPGVGQIGAGYGRVPLICFQAALQALMQEPLELG